MPTGIDLAGLQTEGRNPHTTSIDKVSTLELCQVINDEDSKVAVAVGQCLPEIAKGIDSLVERVQRGGRVIYVGAGTSGRLGVLDASELPPTFTADPKHFVALISGGDRALRYAQEGAEDDVEAAVADLKALNLDGDKDSLIGIAASGRTPYVLSCLSFAHSLGCCTIGVACSFPSAMSLSSDVDHMINAVTGPEVVTGSTRLKAGTATKLVLNMLSTGTMIKIGKTYGNIMIDVKATNAKLRQRARNILRTICSERCPAADAELDELLRKCDGSVKVAVASLMLSSSVPEARERLASAGGLLANVLEQTKHGVDEATGPLVNGHETVPYVLCVDGGGSKCAAVIRDCNGGSWRGQSGGCNPMDVGIDGTISAVEIAVRNAANICPSLAGRNVRELSFDRIWIGLAGYDRPSISVPLTAALEKMFSRSTSNKFRITTDLDLLVTAGTQDTQVKSVIALIAGTGSIAMRFSRDGDKFVRTGRSGGWGYLLGDDGSGFDIGRQAVRHCLASLDEQRNTSGARPQCGPICRLCQRTLRHFVPECGPDQSLDLLSTVIYSKTDDTDVKRRIAGVAPIVIELSDTEPSARDIIDGAVESLVRLVRAFPVSEEENSTQDTLVIAGGLMQSKVFKTKLQAKLAQRTDHKPLAIANRQIICVPDPADSGAESLIAEQAKN